MKCASSSPVIHFKHQLEKKNKFNCLVSICLTEDTTIEQVLSILKHFIDNFVPKLAIRYSFAINLVVFQVEWSIAAPPSYSKRVVLQDWLFEIGLFGS